MTNLERPASDSQLRGFESLISRFQITSSSLERSYRQLQDRVRELSSELEQEREQRIQLERMAAMGEMAMELAHEIRNPLGSIELYASMIDGHDADQIVRSVRLLNNSVTNILEFGEPIHPQFEDVDLGDLLEGLETFLAPIADQKGIRISTRVSDACVCVGDYGLLHRMLLNLSLNALREISNGGNVQLIGETFEDEIRVIVEDDGPGIGAETISRIFDPMFSTSKNGCGLGLPIVKRIVDSHRGKISVESSGSGTRFEIRLERLSGQSRPKASSKDSKPDALARAGGSL